MSVDGEDDVDVVMDDDLEDDKPADGDAAGGGASAAGGSARKSGFGAGRKSIMGRKSVMGARRRSSGIGFARRRSGVGGGPTYDSNVDQSKLADMYSNIIKMSSENKINAKNSWSLDLINHMDHMLLRGGGDDEGGSSAGGGGGGSGGVGAGRVKINFQKASCTLDASIKIYSYRVDETYTSSYRVLESLNRSDNARDADEDGEGGGGDDDDDDDNEGGGAKKHAAVGATKRSARMGLANTLEKNPKNINISNLEREFSVDPLFHKMSKTFDEAGSKGMLLCNLSVADGCRVVFDTGDEDDEEEAESKEEENSKLQKQIDAGTAKAAGGGEGGGKGDDDDEEEEEADGMSDDEGDKQTKTSKANGGEGEGGSGQNKNSDTVAADVSSGSEAVTSAVDVSALRAKLLSLCGGESDGLANTPLCPQFQEFRAELKELGEVQHGHDVLVGGGRSDIMGKGKGKASAADKDGDDDNDDDVGAAMVAGGDFMLDDDDDDDGGGGGGDAVDFGGDGGGGGDDDDDGGGAAGGGDFGGFDGPEDGGADMNMVWGSALAAKGGGSSSARGGTSAAARPSPSGLLDKLCSNVEMVADEYAFFDSGSLAAAAANNWAGVAHWKFAGPKRSKRLQAGAGASSTDANKTAGGGEDEEGGGSGSGSGTTRGKKGSAAAIDFNAPPPPASKFASATAAGASKSAAAKKGTTKGGTQGGSGGADGKPPLDKTVLTAQYLQRAEAAAEAGSLTLPKDMSFKAKDLARLFLRPSAVARRLPAGEEGGDGADGGAAAGGGGAGAQQSNMFLDQEGGMQYGGGRIAFDGADNGGGFGDDGGGGGDDDDDDGGGDGFVFHGFDHDSGGGGDGAGGGGGLGLGGSHVGEDGVIMDDFKGEGLLKARKVEKIDIGFATKAKKVDVRQLKMNLWECVETGTHAKQREKAAAASANKGGEEGDNAAPTLPFSEVLSTVSANEQQEGVTLPFYFICVLHLANEKGLKLEGQDDMLDFQISADPVNQASY